MSAIRPALMIASALLAAGCNKSTDSSRTTTTADGKTVTTSTSTTTTGTAIPSAASLGIQPGKWQTTVAITDLKMQGLPPGVKLPERVPTTITTCITPQQAAKGPGEFLKKAGANCTATSSSYAGGKIDVAMTCTLPMGTLTTKSTGTYSPTAMSSDAEASMTGRMAMTEKVHTEAKRIGDCG